MNENFNRFSSPIFGDMFLLVEDLEKYFDDILFSSPLFGDMFLLKLKQK